LGDYFSDDEENDSWDEEYITSESNPWSQTHVNNSEENFQHSQPTLSEWDPVISGLETIDEAIFENDGEANKLNHISGLSEETKLAFSTWQPFIPENSHLVHKQLLTSQPVLNGFQIGSVSQPCLPTPWPKPTTTPWPPLIRTKPCKPFYSLTYSTTATLKQPFFKQSSTKPATRSQESQGHPQQPKPYQLGKHRSQCSSRTSQNQNPRLQDTPPVTDAGNASQMSTHLNSQIYLNTNSGINTAKTKSWEKKWRKFYNRTPTFRTKLQKNIRSHRKSSRRTRLCLWSQGQYPPICSLNTTATEKLITKRKTSPGENHSSKRRSESKSYSHRKRLNSKSELNLKSESESRNESYCQYERQNFKSENKIKNNKNENVKAVKVRSVEALTKIKAKLTAKVNEVKAIEKTLTGSRIEREKQLNS
jgi:hypothetical protein